MRLFFALDLPSKIRANLRRAGGQISGGESWRWVSPENYHLTLHFLGEREEDELPELLALGKRVSRRQSPFPVDCRGLGTFPQRGRPKVLWAGLDGGEALDSLSLALGGKGSDHHITLARRRNREWGRFQVSESLQRLAFGQWTVSEFHLIESELTKSGPLYTVRKSWKL